MIYDILIYTTYDYDYVCEHGYWLLKRCKSLVDQTTCWITCSPPISSTSNLFHDPGPGMVELVHSFLSASHTRGLDLKQSIC